MPITPGIMQAAGMLNNLFNQGTNPVQSLQNVPNPEAIVSPEDPYQRAGHDPVIELISTMDISGIVAPAQNNYAIVGTAIVGESIAGEDSLVGSSIVGIDITGG